MCLLGLLSGRFLAGLRRFRGVIFVNITLSGEYNRYSYFGGSSKQVGRPSTSPRHQEYALYDSYRTDARCLCLSCANPAGCRSTRELRPFDRRSLKLVRSHQQRHRCQADTFRRRSPRQRPPANDSFASSQAIDLPLILVYALSPFPIRCMPAANTMPRSAPASTSDGQCSPR